MRVSTVLLAGLGAAAVLAACSPEPTPTAAPAATPEPTSTSAPLATPTPEPATSTPMPAPAPTAAPAAAATTTSPPAPTPTPTPGPAASAAPTPRPTPTATVSAPGGPPSGSLVMLADPLDEPEFYCVDVAGFGANLNVNAPLQAHTCKPGADDEMFAFNRPAEGQIYLVEHDRCIQADGASLYVRPCSESPLQRFAYGGDGTLSTGDGGLCLAVAGGDGEPAGGRSHVRRDLLLLPCNEVAPALSQWVFPGPSPSA
ncbi:MAG: RICIN domain-containing protein [Chloroflexi bacterium]|nr:RICIN domain-containing protein [Chloroflexota bacterium]